MGERVALVDANEALDRPVHHVAVDPPLEDVGAQEGSGTINQSVHVAPLTCWAKNQIADRPMA